MAKPAGDASAKLPAIKPRKLALDAPSVEMRLLPDRPEAIPGANGVLILEAMEIAAGHAHLTLYLSGRGPNDGVFVLDEMHARKGQQMALCLPDQQYTVSVRDVVHSVTGKSHVSVEIAEDAPDDRMGIMPVEGRLSDAEEAEIRRIEACEKEFTGMMTGVTWFMIHAADEKKKTEALQAVFSTERFSEDDQCGVGTAIRRAGGVDNYRRSIAAFRTNSAFHSGTGAKALAVLGATQHAKDIAGMLKGGNGPGEVLARRDAVLALGIMQGGNGAWHVFRGAQVSASWSCASA